MTQKRILLIIGGGIAAYKSAELIRTIRKAGHAVRCVMTKGGAQFVTPLTLGALSEDKVYTDLFDLKDEAEMGHMSACGNIPRRGAMSRHCGRTASASLILMRAKWRAVNLVRDGCQKLNAFSPKSRINWLSNM